MCGFAGMAHANPAHLFDRSVLEAMRDAQTHRGPDDAGTFLAPGVALGSRRLSIIDLSPRGRMPMSTPDGRYHIAYNGEVFNYRELRSELVARGHTFDSDTDTEVVLRLYAEGGPAILDRLNGMFAFAIWDATKRELFLARDRLGVKPLFYALVNDVLMFSSEIKGLVAGGLTPRFDAGCWEELLLFRFVAGQHTPFEGVRRLRPGHALRFASGQVTVAPWWSLADRTLAARSEPPEDAPGWYRTTFDDAVARRRISDVPVGVLLSGGLDSGSVAASLGMMGAAGLASFTVRFPEAAYDEGPLAHSLASKWGLEHHELVVSESELPARLRRATWLSDEPLAHASDLHILAISELAKSRVSVLLCGEGADETLGGYGRYRPLRHPRVLALARGLLALGKALPGRMGKLGRLAALGSVERMVLFNACEVLPHQLLELGMQPTLSFPFREAALEEARRLHPGRPFRQAMHLDQLTFLESLLTRNDRMTMGASIECRVPFLDYRLVEGLSGLPSSVLERGRRNKPLLRRALGSRLPRPVLRARKRGFPVPWHTYLRRQPELRARVAEVPDAVPVRDGPFDRAKVRAVVDRYLAGDDRPANLVRPLLMVTIWHEVCCGQGASG